MEKRDVNASFKQECIPVGCVPSALCPYLPACTAQGGCTWSQGVYLPSGGVPGPGVYLVPGGCTCQGLACPGTPSLGIEFLTHASENNTLPQTSFAGGNNAVSATFLPIMSFSPHVN